MDDGTAAFEEKTIRGVEELKSVASFVGKGALQKKMEALRSLRRLLLHSAPPPAEAVVNAGVIPVLIECLSFGSSAEQLLELAWCLTHIATGELQQTKSLLPALPLLIAHLGERSSIPVVEQSVWALGNVAGEGEEFRHILLAQGALLPLARLMLSNKASTTRTATWACQISFRVGLVKSH